MKKLSSFVLAFSLLLAAHAQNGVWTNPNGGSWADSANWQGGVIAQGVDSIADFSTLSLSADATVTLDGNQAVGQVIFGDRANAHNWFLNPGTGGTLALSGSANPTTITVSNQAATIAAQLTGSQGLTQNGSGLLILEQAAGYFGGTTNNAGVLELFSSFNTTNNPTSDNPLVVNNVVESAATLNLDVNQNNDGGSTNILGTGVLRLVGTTNNAASPDLFFCPDAYENYYYGAALDSATLDLGSSQRYIFALTGHNAIARYDPWEDARINANIVGTGGITYIAQNTYGGGSPMECQLILAGSNTFTGPLEIQRGSVYLLNASALAETNLLLMDPAETNNARLFLYGNGATVSNLQSSGAGKAVIANGNVNNPITIAPAALTVVQTSNTVFAGALVDGQYEYDDGTTPPGSLSLEKDGPAQLTLTGLNAYTGSTIINAGDLVVPATQTGGGSFTVGDGAALGVAGIDGNVLAMSDLALGNGGPTTLEFTFSGSPVNFAAPITTASLEVYGGPSSVTINVLTNGAGIPVGQYPLIHYTSGVIGGAGVGFSVFRLHSLPTGVVGSLVNNTLSNSIDMKITTGTAIPPQNGIWSNPNGGSWGDSANWRGGGIAQGIGFTANFAALSLGADATVTLDGPETIGSLIFGDQGNAHNWALNTGSSGALALRSSSGSPIITVSNQIATIGAALTGTQGLTQNGAGTLVLVQPVGYTGGTTNGDGVLEFLSDFNTINNQTFSSPLIVDGVVETASTLNLDVNQNNNGGSTNILGTGTLRLVGATNGPANPDLFFCPDAYQNYYYGANLDTPVLDLGSRQRYIFALTEHNAVAQYDPWEDARIDANIIGSGGITYIAQNTYGGQYPMECPLVLAGSNTFTGELEIQRGSVYLFTPQALAQTNDLLIDPVGTNNARLFLYGNDATVANLTGSGNALIANANVDNPVVINPATLTVVQSSDTAFSGVIVDSQYEYDGGANPSAPLSLLKEGPGTLTLTDTNTYTGLTSVAGGELVVLTGQTGEGPFNVANGTALGIQGVGTNSLNISDLALGAGGNTTLEFFFSGSLTAFSTPIVTSSLEVNGGANSVTLNIRSVSGIPVGQYPLINYLSGSVGGTGAGYAAFHLGALPAGLSATLVNNTTDHTIDLSVTGSQVAPVFSGFQGLTNGSLSLSFTGPSGAGFSVHATTNVNLTPLSAWPVIGSGVFGAAGTTFTVPVTNQQDFFLISSP